MNKTAIGTHAHTYTRSHPTHFHATLTIMFVSHCFKCTRLSTLELPLERYFAPCWSARTCARLHCHLLHLRAVSAHCELIKMCPAMHLCSVALSISLFTCPYICVCQCVCARACWCMDMSVHRRWHPHPLVAYTPHSAYTTFIHRKSELIKVEI